MQGKADEELRVLRRAKFQHEGTEDFHQWCVVRAMAKKKNTHTHSARQWHGIRTHEQDSNIRVAWLGFR